MVTHPSPRLLAACAALLMLWGCGGCDGRGATDAGPSLDDSLAQIAATCAQVSGTTQLRRRGATFWEPMETGAILREGDWIRTGPGGYARIEFLSGGGLELTESSVVVVERAAPAAGPDTDPTADLIAPLIAVKQGEVTGFSRSNDTAKDRPVALKLKDGSTLTVGASKGSGPVKFRVTATSEKTELAITQGEARLKSAAGEQTLRKGQSGELKQARVAEVVELIAFPESLAPRLDEKLSIDKGARIAFSWTEVPEAAGYRLQIAADLGFHQVSSTTRVNGTHHSVALPGGSWWWRVAASDGHGRYGEYGFARRLIVEERSQPDLLHAPADGEVITTAGKSAKVVFEWKEAPAISDYRLVLSRSAELSDPIFAETTDELRLAVSPLPVGEYHWGIYAAGEQGQRLFVKPRRLVVKREFVQVNAPDAIDQWGD